MTRKLRSRKAVRENTSFSPPLFPPFWCKEISLLNSSFFHFFLTRTPLPASALVLHEKRNLRPRELTNEYNCQKFYCYLGLYFVLQIIRHPPGKKNIVIFQIVIEKSNFSTAIKRSKIPDLCIQIPGLLKIPFPNKLHP